MHVSLEMIEAGAEYLYGRSRQSAIEMHEEARFQACCQRAETLFNLMLAAATPEKFKPSQQQLARAEPVGTNPRIW